MDYRDRWVLEDWYEALNKIRTKISEDPNGIYSLILQKDLIDAFSLDVLRLKAFCKVCEAIENKDKTILTTIIQTATEED